MYKTVVVFRVKNYFYVLTRKTIFVWIVRSVWTYPGCPCTCARDFSCLTEEASRSKEASRLPYNYFEKGCRKNVHAQVPKGNMGYDQHKVTVPDTVAVEPTFVAFFSTGKHNFMASLAFFQISLKSSAQNYPQYLSGWSRALFSTTFLEIAVYCVRQFSSRQTCKAACVCKGSSRFS